MTMIDNPNSIIFNPFYIFKPKNFPTYKSRALITDFWEKFDDAALFFHVLTNWLTLFSFQLINVVRKFFDISDERSSAAKPVSDNKPVVPPRPVWWRVLLADMIYIPLTVIYYLGEAVKWSLSYLCAALCSPIIYLVNSISKSLKKTTLGNIKVFLQKIIVKNSNEYADSADFYFDYTTQYDSTNKSTKKIISDFESVREAELMNSCWNNNSEKTPPNDKGPASLVLRFYPIHKNSSIERCPITIPINVENAADIDAIAQLSRKVANTLFQNNYYDSAGRNPFTPGYRT